MIVLKLGLWTHKASKHYTYDRIYLSGYRWTPLCRRYPRQAGYASYNTELWKEYTNSTPK